MKAYELFESRGVTAREPGEQYVSSTDPNDILTIQNIKLLPEQGAEYNDLEELLSAIEQEVPANVKKVNDNTYNNSNKAAILAYVTDSNGAPQVWIRYLKSIPPQGVHGIWRTFRGYKYKQGAEKESVPIKPVDFIQNENYYTVQQLVQTIKSKTSGYGDLGKVLDNAIDQALAGTSNPIPDSGVYFNVLQKYAGEYLGPIALMSHPNSVSGNTSEMMEIFGINNFSGAKIMFPQSATAELIDSIIKLNDGRTIKISSKISKSGGAASSLSGIYKQMTQEIEQKFPFGSEIIKLLATESAINGPLKVAELLGVIDRSDIVALANLDKSSRNIEDIKSSNLQKITKNQGVAPGTLERPDYRVLWHALTAIVNTIIPIINSNEEFSAAMLEILNNNEYVQIVTNGRTVNNAVSLSYSTKFPAVFKGSPKLFNKVYYATSGGQKGRLGFKLK